MLLKHRGFSDEIQLREDHVWRIRHIFSHFHPLNRHQLIIVRISGNPGLKYCPHIDLNIFLSDKQGQ